MVVLKEAFCTRCRLLSDAPAPADRFDDTKVADEAAVQLVLVNTPTSAWLSYNSEWVGRHLVEPLICVLRDTDLPVLVIKRFRKRGPTRQLRFPFKLDR